MATIAEFPPGCVVFDDVSWEFYEHFLEEFDGQYVRHTYDVRTLEIMSPISLRHESLKRLITRLVQTLVEEKDIPILCVGSMTLKCKRKAKGIEPDECFYVAHEADMRSRTDYDPDHDPPPDLAIEIDWTSSSVPRMPVYAKLGVAEVWRFKKKRLAVFTLSPDGEYAESETSLAFPFLPLDEFRGFLNRDPAVDETTWIRRFREWVRTRLAK